MAAKFRLVLIIRIEVAQHETEIEVCIIIRSLEQEFYSTLVPSCAIARRARTHGK